MFTHQCCDKTYVFSWAEIFWYLCQNLVCSISFNTILNSKLHRTKRNTLRMRLKSKYLGKLGELRTICFIKIFRASILFEYTPFMFPKLQYYFTKTIMRFSNGIVAATFNNLLLKIFNLFAPITICWTNIDVIHRPINHTKVA